MKISTAVLFLFCLLSSSCATNNAKVDDAVHKGHVRKGAAVIGGAAGAAIFEKNRFFGGMVGVGLGDALGNAFENNYKAKKESEERRRVQQRRQDARSN